MNVNWRDLIERVGWTTIQAGAGAGLVVLTTGVDWQEGLKMVGVASGIAFCKVVLAQRVGTRGSGDAIPGGVES